MSNWCYSLWVTSPSQTRSLYESNLSTNQPTSIDERTSRILDTVAVTKQDGWQPGAQSGQRLSQQTELASLVVFYLLGTRQSEDLSINLLRPGFNSQVGKIPWRRKWQPTPVFLPGEFHGQRSLVGYSPWNCKESDRTQQLIHHMQLLTFTILLGNSVCFSLVLEHIFWILSAFCLCCNKSLM